VSPLASDALAMFQREMLRYRRDRAYWLGQIAFPLAFVGAIGFGLDRVVVLPSGVGYASHLASGMLALLVGSGAVGGGFSLIEDRETGFLRALWIAPVSRASLVLGKLLARLAVSLVLVGILLALLGLVTPVRLAHPLALLLAVASLTAIFAALGIALATRLRRLESFRTLAAGVTVPLYLGSGIFYPIATLPTPVRVLAYANPLTWGVDLLRFGVLGVHELPLALGSGALVALAAVATGLAIVAFDRGAL
jgi:ABC-2 type transport system permease protein